MAVIFQAFGYILGGSFGLIVFGILTDMVVRAFQGKGL